MKKQLTIKKVLIISFSTLLLSVFSLLSGIIFFRYNIFQKNQLHHFAQSTASQIACTFETYFDELESLAEVIASNSTLLDNWNALQATDDYDAYLAHKNIQQFLNDIQKNRNDIISIGVFDQSTYIELDNYKKNYEQGDPFLNNIWLEFNEIVTMEPRYYGLHLFDYYHNTLLQSPPTVISMVYPIRDVNRLSSKNEALLIFDIDLSHIKDLVFNEEYSSNTYTALILDGSQIIYSSDDRNHKTGEFLSEYQSDIAEQIIVDVPMSSTGWHIRILYDTSVMTQQANALLAFIIGILIVAFLALLITIIGISRQISKPIWALVDKMSEIHSDNLSTESLSLNKPTSLYELQMLYSGYNYLMDQIIALKIKSYEMEIKQQEVNYKALQAQIDPHFINNLLQMIQSLAILNKVTEIRKITSVMADLLEYTVYSKENYVPLYKEIHYVEKYLEMQRIRLGPNFQYYIEVSHDVEQMLIPRFILQPLVENAVIHGIDDAVEKEITVECELLEGIVYLNVKDNGKGMKSEQLDAIRNSLEQDIQSGSGIGLYNVNRRITTRYGKAYGIEIQSEIDVGTCVTIAFPAQEGE